MDNQILQKIIDDIAIFEKILIEEHRNTPNGASWNTDYLESFIKYDTLFRAGFFKLKFNYPNPKFDSADEVMSIIFENYKVAKIMIDKSKSEIIYNSMRQESENRYDIQNDDTLLLNDAQKSEIQTQINALRENLQDSQWLSDEHQQRLLKKINEFQTEFDKNIGSYYKKLGMLEDLGDSLGEFGKNAKPFGELVDKITGSFKVFRRQNPQIGKDSDPLQIEDMTDEGGDE